ncbi:bifunctional 3'-5' exonuclease/DNA polymerase [Nakamurella antarctica]|uniref:bifunctional 3'-5' exonuclease/DNA polymerase n=1 Tax=Nakamurella antarctica TaxID=1902245 RepID=UPI0013DE223D|nr:bifunctional 3'-5' exonuclease/DNA polymerase [Nakamurella antarctica]
MLAVIAPVPRAVDAYVRWEIQLLNDDNSPLGLPREISATEVAALESEHRPRWIFNDAPGTYGPLLAAGVRIERCHDIMMTERLLLPRQGQYGEPAAAQAISARLHSQPAPPDPEPAPTIHSAMPGQQAMGLFEEEGPAAQVPGIRVLLEAYVDQRERIDLLAEMPVGEGISVNPGAFKLLVAADSACALIGVEMTRVGMPWRREIHEQILQARLGPRPKPGTRPAVMADLAAQINEAFGFAVNPDSPADLRAAFARLGVEIETTRAWVLRTVEHPAVEHILNYKELQRLYTANGWNWLDEWVHNGRFRAEYVPAGVVTGRWATRGGGALQIPKIIRGAVRADPGCTLVVADAAQLEPRVLVAVSGDPALEALADAEDLYTALAEFGFSNDRNKAKIAMLGTMYGQTSGAAGAWLATLRYRYPVAMDFLEDAARRGEQGRLVTTILGRTSNPPSGVWTEIVDAGAGPAASRAQESQGRRVARDRGRFTRNFVIQGAAADWAAVWLSTLRQSLRAVDGADIVFFQHDELMVHTPVDSAKEVARLTSEAADTACRLVFPGGRARTPVRPIITDCYADAK